jgi:hypothetical protein
MDLEYNASTDFSVAWAHLESNDLDLTGPSDDREEADSFWMSQLEILGLEDLRDNTCNDALRFFSKAKTVGEIPTALHFIILYKKML